jgi:hypothetical protein
LQKSKLVIPSSQKIYKLTITSLLFFETKTLGGILFEILDLVQSQLNFTYNLVPSLEGGFGILNESNMWTGIVGSVQRNEVNFTIMGLTVTPERAEVCIGIS